MPYITLFVARADNGVIGRDGALPWHLPDDLKRFKTLTMGKPMIMGRKTFESLPGLLPGRPHIVITRDPAWTSHQPVTIVSTAEAALAAAGGAEEVAVIGGAEIFALFMPLASRIELTEVHRIVEGDVRMPPLGAGWHVAARTLGGPDFDFVTLVRSPPALADAG